MYGAQIWFDGGIEGKARPAITAMLKKLQPKAVAFNGCVVQGGVEPSPPCLSAPNFLRSSRACLGRSSHYLTASPTSMKQPQNKTAGWNRNHQSSAGAAQNRSTCITPNALRWIGTEAGIAPDPNWSSGTYIRKNGSFLLKCLPSIVLPTKQTLNLSRQAPVKLRCDCS